MREYDAQRNGYTYCGPVLGSFPRDRELSSWQESLKLAKKIKKEYNGADYVIATGTKDGWLSSGSKGLYGNEVFNQIWDLLRYNKLDQMPERLSKAKKQAEEKYKQTLADIERMEKDYQAKVNLLNSLRK